VVAVSAGWSHSLALRADGTVVAWGGNDFGKSTVPAGLTNVVAIAGAPSQSWVLRADGTVIVSKMQGDGKGYGNYVVVDHGGGNFTLDAHMSKRAVSAGQTVKAGDVIGYAGTTGDSTGVHVHHGYCKNWNGSDKEWEDPLPMLKEAYIMQNKEHWGMKYLKNLVKKGIIQNPDTHEKTLDEPITKAEVFALIDRATDK
jgi:murein DD-endopeptidase MepM/ murein hydrolase activator NlpD